MLFHTIIENKIVFRVVFDTKLNKKVIFTKKYNKKLFFTNKITFFKYYEQEKIWYTQELEDLKLRLKLI